MQFEQHWLTDQAKRDSSQLRLGDTQFEGEVRRGGAAISHLIGYGPTYLTDRLRTSLAAGDVPSGSVGFWRRPRPL
jgi:hypothetical protein